MPFLMTKPLPPRRLTTGIAGISAKPRPQADPVNELACPQCGKVCKSKLGLGSHMRSHGQ